VPLRIEIGRATWSKRVVFARRDVPGKEGKTFGVPVAQIAQAASDMLTTIQAAMLQRATDFREANTRTVKDSDEFKQVLERAGRLHPGALGRQQRGRGPIKDETKATIRCYPFDAPEAKGSASTRASGRAGWRSSRGRISILPAGNLLDGSGDL